jgi:nucleotide-binding universal stress UspA family protein
MKIDQIVVPLDFGSGADRALPVARALADQLGARVGVVVVTDPAPGGFSDVDEARWHGRHAGCRIDDVTLRTDEDVVAGILAAVSSRSLLCLATNAPGAVVDLALRSIGEQVLCRSSAPVLAVGPSVAVEAPPTVEHLLCCVDDEPAVTEVLLDAAAQWSDIVGGDVHLVRVVPRPAHDDRDAVLGARESLDAVVRRLWARGVAATSGIVVADDVGEGIVRTAATHPGAVAMLATHGRSGLRRLRFGSVALDVVRDSPVPVLVVPASGVRRPIRDGERHGTLTG